MHTIGTVDWYDDERGYGFIVSPDIESMIFVHATKIVDIDPPTLAKHQIVECDVVTNTKGLAAVNVRSYMEGVT